MNKLEVIVREYGDSVAINPNWLYHSTNIDSDYLSILKYGVLSKKSLSEEDIRDIVLTSSDLFSHNGNDRVSLALSHNNPSVLKHTAYNKFIRQHNAVIIDENVKVMKNKTILVPNKGVAAIFSKEHKRTVPVSPYVDEVQSYDIDPSHIVGLKLGSLDPSTRLLDLLLENGINIKLYDIESSKVLDSYSVKKLIK